MAWNCLQDAALEVLTSSQPAAKVAATERAFELWEKGVISWRHHQFPGLPDFPSRPSQPELLPPKEMPKRGVGSTKGRFALIHSLAHIELNAIDLAWDLLLRFGHDAFNANAGPDFISDWLKVAAEEAIHFQLLTQRLKLLGGEYGDLPAHQGLWEAAYDTRSDLIARLALVPMVLEARGLDVSPNMIDGMKRMGDEASAALLERIYQDEIGHVRIGTKWFHLFCEQQNRDPKEAFQSSVKQYFKGVLKAPFNVSAREAAAFPMNFVEN